MCQMAKSQRLRIYKGENMEKVDHPDSYNIGDPDNPTITYEEYMKEVEKNGTSNQSTDSAE